MAEASVERDSEAAEQQVLRYGVDKGVAWIRLNRPDKMNAIDGALRQALAGAVRRVERDAEAKVVVVTGEGRAFCAGADVRELGQPSGSVSQVRQDYESLLVRLYALPKPTIAAMNGVAAGIGASLALVCDLRYAVPEARFLEAFVKIGLTVDGGVSWLLPRLIGSAKALEMFYTGEPMSAAEAERLGLVNRVVSPEELESSVRELAERLAAGPTLAMGGIKRSVNHAADATLEEAMEFEFHLQQVMTATEDFREGAAAFLEKRAPRFKGR